MKKKKRKYIHGESIPNVPECLASEPTGAQKAFHTEVCPGKKERRLLGCCPNSVHTAVLSLCFSPVHKENPVPCSVQDPLECWLPLLPCPLWLPSQQCLGVAPNSERLPQQASGQAEVCPNKKEACCGGETTGRAVLGAGAPFGFVMAQLTRETS